VSGATGSVDGAGSTAVLLCVPEAEPVVHAWRSTGDPTAARGVPAHVTLLSPFLPQDRVDEGVLAELEWFFAGVDAFRLRFSAVGCFESDGVVFLEPDGDGLDELAAALSRRWPETPPYHGKHENPHAHLTVVHTDDGQLRSRASAAVQEQLPLVARAAHAALWTCDSEGRWSEAAVFPFGPSEE
jgi:hypothetical protein